MPSFPDLTVSLQWPGSHCTKSLFFCTEPLGFVRLPGLVAGCASRAEKTCSGYLIWFTEGPAPNYIWPACGFPTQGSPQKWPPPEFAGFGDSLTGHRRYVAGSLRLLLEIFSERLPLPQAQRKNSPLSPTHTWTTSGRGRQTSRQTVLHIITTTSSPSVKTTPASNNPSEKEPPLPH